MAGPEQVRAWAEQRRVGRARSPYSQAVCGESAGIDSRPTFLRFAWLGRVSTKDMQDPTLSLPRQLGNSQRSLPEDGLIVAHFYDVESGRMDLDARGSGRAHEQFDIPIPRDGGIQDLLAEAERPDRRFDYVICESIERTARHMFYGTSIEHRLERAGVRLLAADEPFQLAAVDGRKPKRATQLLTRRMKQSISEFYVVDMLEKSWDGYAVHAEAGYNIGKPCYGYRARRVPHPVPAKRAKGIKKTFLELDPDRAPTVRVIFNLRTTERLSYQAIADRLNVDPVAYPPPVPADPARGVGCWTYSNVRDILTNPKYTGHMVWNRRARKTRNNKANPVEEWIWSAQPVHAPLVDLETWLQAQDVGGHRFGSRSISHTNAKHPQTKRAYLLRTYLFCEACGRRMYGKSRRDLAYYVCAPKKGYAPKGHPTASSFWVREEVLVDKLNEFLAAYVFGAYRRDLLGGAVQDLGREAQRERQRQLAALRREIDDAGRMIKNLVRSFARIDEPTDDLVREINEERAELHKRKARLAVRLAELEAEDERAPNPQLLDLLPTGEVQVESLPEEVARRLFEVLRLELRYHKPTNCLKCTVTLAGATIPAARQAAAEAVVLPFDRKKSLDQRKPERNENKEDAMSDITPVPILAVPSAGLEPAT
ncbi:recombinase family protein [Amycolatopsis sp. NPDC059021]|uniref:recombinase family protein n=1 Tax=Amycolatopsis sp. NPDC059021 TaxID=3346704 RepID=UPI00366D9868